MAQHIIIFIYFLILFLIGFLASKKVKNIKDYYVGGKKLGYWVVAFSTRATGESAWLLLGLTGLGAMAGVSAFWVVVGEVLGVAIAWLVMAKKFKKLTDDYDAITIPDYLVSRFQSKTHILRIIAATALSIFVVIYVSAQIDATGAAFESFLDWNYYTGAIVGFCIVVLYIFFGGFVAVAWSDFFQGMLMFLGLLFLPLFAFFSLGTEVSIIEELRQIDESLLNGWGKGGLNLFNISTLLGYMMIGLGFMGSPQLFVRFMSIKDESEIDKGRWVAIIFTLLTDIAAVCIGILGRVLLNDMGLAQLGNGGQNVLPLLVDNLFPAIIAGIYIAVVLSAIMSTIDSLLVVASSAIIRDFYQQIFRTDTKEEQLDRLARLVTIILALFALGIALTVAFFSPERTIFWFVIFGWSGIAATFCPMIILSLFWKNYTEKGAIASMIVGFMCVPIFKFGVAQIPNIGMYFEQIDVLLPSFLLSMFAGYLVSKLMPHSQKLD